MCITLLLSCRDACSHCRMLTQESLQDTCSHCKTLKQLPIGLSAFLQVAKLFSRRGAWSSLVLRKGARQSSPCCSAWQGKESSVWPYSGNRGKVELTQVFCLPGEEELNATLFWFQGSNNISGQADTLLARKAVWLVLALFSEQLQGRALQIVVLH